MNKEEAINTLKEMGYTVIFVALSIVMVGYAVAGILVLMSGIPFIFHLLGFC